MKRSNLRKNSEYNKYTQINQNKKSNDKKQFLIFIILIFLIFLTIFCFMKFNLKEVIDVNNSDINISKNSNNTTQDNTNTIEPISFSLSAIGDIMCHNSQYIDAYISSTDTYDFSYVFDDIKNYIEPADISIGNLETSFAGKEVGYSNYPQFNSPEELAYSLSDIGIDILSTAGNHCLDKGFSGLSNTLNVLDNANISHTGTARTKEERDSILFKDIKGVKVAFISYTYGTNGIPIPEDKDFCVNLIDKDLIKKDIESAKSQNADVIIACMHWGIEYQTTQNAEQENLANFLFENGVDIILGNHPHVLQPMEQKTVTLEDGTTKDCFVIYAFGNFICDQNAENTRSSIILNMNITKNADGKISIDNVDYVPIYMYKNPNLNIRKMKVLDIEKSIQDYETGKNTSIGQATYNLLLSELKRIDNTLKKP